ncbi:MAG: TolB family protein, partial [Hyphomicrobiales bacterium]
RCLEKDPDDRWQTARDLLLELKWVGEAGSRAGVAAPIAHRRKTRERIAWGVAGVAILATAVFAYGFVERAPKKGELIRFYVMPQEGLRNIDSPRISPDGKYLAFNATDSTGKTLIYIRPLSALAAQPLPGTEGARRPFWSPDSRYLAFMADNKLKKIPVGGGPPITICDAPNGADGSWSAGDVILFDGSSTDSLRMVSAAGGIAAPAGRCDHAANEIGQAWPHFLPDGKHYLYIGVTSGQGESHLRVGTLGSPESKVLLNGVTRTEYVPQGYLLYVRDHALMAQRFDAKALKTTGEPFPIADDVNTDFAGNADFSASTTGVLAYSGGASGGAAEMTWYDRTGKPVGTEGAPGEIHAAIASPDGTRIAYQVVDPSSNNDDIWVLDVARGVRSRLTFDPATDAMPLWSPDGKRIAFASNRAGAFAAFVMDAAGGSEPVKVSNDPDNIGPTSWTADGTGLVCIVLRQAAQWDLVLVPADGKGAATPIVTTRFSETSGEVSPDGKWLAYRSTESGRGEIYVRSFPGSGERWQVSTEGGGDPHWRADGKELFFRHGDQLWSAPFTGGSAPAVGIAKLICTLPPVNASGVTGTGYWPNAAGTKFLVVKQVANATLPPATLVVNWPTGLGAR